jgi:hypothetical protein
MKGGAAPKPENGTLKVWMRCLEGLGLIGAGFFSVDPAPGYPKGAILTSTLQ